ncbi:histidine kinase dimerization/phosphoacceptor domain -containing protein [Hymenobacter sp. YC55]|uniref:tetratricopeptide repeat-containing sensor histidine kinase n=1 Tax=Hymenobacter sp. YC55 TaxID=3034019 RepID=UPI0023FA16D8|nr:histidine kinase dimerization/phosphoacceptor domain -containing protein [Hymenobacter sp. YC55]MDF7814075.1 histidine kinase dimerization/phosphoacceptor domain -containing protein [Hymenobacter sp. YC55]
MKYLLALLLFIACTGQAEPLYPLLSQKAVDSLQQLRRQSKPDTQRVRLLLQLGEYIISRNRELQIMAGGQVKQGVDSAYAYSSQAAALSQTLHFTSGTIASLQALGRLNQDQDKEAARAQLRESIRLARQHGYWKLEAIGWLYLGRTYRQKAEDLPEKERCFRQALALFQRQGGRTREVGYMLVMLAAVHLFQHQSVQAQGEIAQALAIYRAVGYKTLHYTYEMLCFANRQNGDYQAGLKSAIAAVKNAHSTQDTSLIFNYYTRLAEVYVEVNQPEEALLYFQKALQSAKLRKNPFFTVAIAGRLSQVLLAQHKPQQALDLMLTTLKNEGYGENLKDEGQFLYYLAECYSALGDYAQAEKYYLQMLATVGTHTLDPEKTLAYFSIGKYYLLTSNYPKARGFLNKARVASSANGFGAKTADIELLLFKVDSAERRFPAAIAHYQQYKTLKDSIFSTTKSKQLAALQIEYDTEQKEQNIALLTKRNAMQQMTIRQRGFQRNVFIGGTLLLASLLGLGYNRYRLKQRSARLLEQKQLALETQQAEIHRKNHALEQVVSEKDQLLEERQGLLVEKDWMLKEIHHRVKNNLQVVSSLLSTQSRHLHDPQAVAAIRESQNRVQVMALLHQKLYQADNLGRVNLADYARDIVTYLVESFDRQRSVLVQLELAPIELETTVATPLGLIINEAVTNALKHAFPSSRRGTLTVRLVSLAPSFYELTISDDGVGLPPGFNLKRSRSLGMVIIKGLSRQLDGQLAVSSADGVCLNLQFDTRKKPVPAEATV